MRMLWPLAEYRSQMATKNHFALSLKYGDYDSDPAEQLCCYNDETNKRVPGLRGTFKRRCKRNDFTRRAITSAITSE